MRNTDNIYPENEETDTIQSTETDQEKTDNSKTS